MALDFDGARLANEYETDEHREWRHQLNRFFNKEIAPYAADWDEQCSLPDQLWLKAASIGILGLGYPEQYGGTSQGIDVWHKNILNEEFSRIGVGGLGASLMVHNIALPPIIHFGSDDLKQEIAVPVIQGKKRISLAITEPGAGSDVAQLSTTAILEGDEYIINGSKTYITGGMKANWFTTAVRTGDKGAGGVSALVIPADARGVQRTALDKKQGWWCSDTATIYFDDVRVPASNLLGKKNGGFKVIMHNFNAERMGMAASMEGFSRVCLEEAVNWAQERKTFGQRLADHQVIRHKIAEMRRKIFATSCYLQVTSRQIQLGKEDAAAIALLKVQASQTLEFCAREAMQILGGMGYMRGNKVERIYREVRVNAIGGGSEEIMRDLAIRQLNL